VRVEQIGRAAVALSIASPRCMPRCTGNYHAWGVLQEPAKEDEEEEEPPEIEPPKAAGTPGGGAAGGGGSKKKKRKGKAKRGDSAADPPEEQPAEDLDALLQELNIQPTVRRALRTAWASIRRPPPLLAHPQAGVPTLPRLPG